MLVDWTGTVLLGNHVRIGRISLAALLAWSMAAPMAAAQPPNELDGLLARALDMHQAGDLLGAVDAYRVVLQSAPDRADVRSNLGAAYIRLGKFDEALREYGEAVRLAPDNPTYRFNLGLALYKASQIEEAAAELERVVKLEPGNFNATLVLADCYSQLGRDAEVVEMLTPLDAAFSDNLAYAYLLGNSLLRSGKQEAGQVLIDRIFRAGESAEGHLLMGLAYINSKDYKSAVTELERAVELKPDLPRARALYARALLSSGDQEGAARQFLRALEATPNDFEANLQLGGIRQRQQRFDDAMIYLNRAAAIRPDDLAVRHALATVHLGLGAPERAVQLLEEVVAQVPDFVDAHVLLATTYYRLKRKEDGDRQREIVARLTAERQAKQPGAQPPASANPPQTPEGPGGGR
jgi:tetratricopeptide (TPR) repeat protein